MTPKAETKVLPKKMQARESAKGCYYYNVEQNKDKGHEDEDIIYGDDTRLLGRERDGAGGASNLFSKFLLRSNKN